MSLDDFCRCTPSEFYAIHKAWKQRQEELHRDAWERQRMACLCSIQPYSTKHLTPRDIMEFPWEEEGAAGHREAPRLSPEEEKERYRAARRRLGLK